MSDISLSSGSLVVDVERKQVTETIAAVDQGNVSLDSGLLVTKKFASKLNENIKGAMGAMRAATIKEDGPISENPERQFYQSGVPMDQRVTEPEAVGVPDPTVVTMEPADKKVEIPQAPEVTTQEITQPEATQSNNVDAIEALKKERIAMDREAQKLLGITVDGDFSIGSKRSLASFQYKAGLPVSGKIDPDTMKALRDPNSADPRNAEPKIDVLNADGNAPDMTKVKEWAKETIADPMKAAAFVSTVEFETGEDTLVETGYNKVRAIEVFVDPYANEDGTLGPKMTARKAAIDALPSNYSADDIFDIVYGNRLGNTEPSDGSTYKGRGLIQLTGKDNYKKVGEIIGVDLVANPDLVNDPKYAAPAAMAYLSLSGKDFFAKDVTQASLAATVGHTGGTAAAKTRFDRAKELKEEMYP